MGTIALRNVHIDAPQQTDYVQPGSDVELLFVAANSRRTPTTSCVGITSDIGTVTLSGDTRSRPAGVLIVGKPEGAAVARCTAAR